MQSAWWIGTGGSKAGSRHAWIAVGGRIGDVCRGSGRQKHRAERVSDLGNLTVSDVLPTPGWVVILLVATLIGSFLIRLEALVPR
jgi:hypothetical protein